MESAGIDVNEYGYYVQNEWRKAADNKSFEVHEPYTGKIFARVAAGSHADARVAVDAAAKAFPAWAGTTPAERARLFLKAAEIVRRRRNEIAETLARETGSTISFSTFQQDLVAATLQQVAGWVFLPKGEVLETNAPGSHSIGVRRPLGVVASFTPWNGANILSWRAVISPVAAGNTVVVKPSELAPVSAGVMLAEVAEEAGFPAGVINVVTHAPGAAGVIADEFFDRPEVRVINLIGGVKTARMLAERAGRTLKRTVLELDGFNPMIILDDVDMDYAVRTATFGSFFHQGQICLNTRRIIVQRKIYAVIANEETFGPVVLVEAVDTPEDAITAANRTMYGLTSSILAGNTYKAFEMAPKIQAGIVNVNLPTVNDEIHAPMGGVRDSGWGRTGPRSLDDFSDVIWINSQSGQTQYPF
jgi:acyl-CoA reductase-like NAD-dependent aldehyde dehydrogenase